MIDELRMEIARNKNLLPAYDAIGIIGVPAKLLIEFDIKLAEDAIAEGDTVQMIRSLVTLRNNK